MSYITIPSVLHPTERAYKLNSSSLDLYSKRGERCLFDHITQYETYGDGICQHGPDWCVQFHELEDVCLSFAAAITADPKNEEWEHLRWYQQGFFKREDIRFAFTVKYKEDTYRYFSRDDHKIAKHKQHDRRYEKIEPRHDGSAESVFGIVYRDSMDWLVRVRLAVEIAAVCEEIAGYWVSAKQVFSPLKDLGDQWDSAYRAFANAVKAAALLRETEHMLTILDSNRRRLIELEAEKAAKATENAA